MIKYIHYMAGKECGENDNAEVKKIIGYQQSRQQMFRVIKQQEYLPVFA